MSITCGGKPPPGRDLWMDVGECSTGLNKLKIDVGVGGAGTLDSNVNLSLAGARHRLAKP